MESSKWIKTNLTTILDSPSDPLLLILSRLDQKDIRSLSLVCKPFLHHSNHFVRKLTFKTLPSARIFREIFTWFSYVNQITLKTKRVLNALTAISKSQLNLEALKIASCPTYPEHHHMLSLSGKLKIKSLVLFDFSKFKVDQVVDFIGLFSSIEELYFGVNYQWDDAGIESLSSVVTNLRKFDLSRNHLLTDRALYALSANCVNLEHIGIDDCRKLTPQGFCTFLHGCRNLRYLDLPSFSLYPTSDLLLAETISACENVHHLSIDSSLIGDATLVLCAFQDLTRLDICLPLLESDKFLDEKMREHMKSLPCLTGVFITSYCPIYTTLFSLIENCPLMECIYLNMNVSYDNSCCVVPVPRLIRKNYNVKYLRLHPCPDASSMIALASFCPCLKRKWDGNVPWEAFFPTIQ